MGRKLRTGPLFLNPSLFVLVAAGILLPIIVFVFWRWWPNYHRRYDVAELTIVHVQRRGELREQTTIFAMRDGTFFENNEQFAILALGSHCKQFRGVVPSELSLAKVKSIIGAPDFEPLMQTDRTRSDLGWYVRARIGSQRKCGILSEERASQSPTFRPVMEWFEAMKTSGSTQKRLTGDCSNQDLDFLEQWCEVDN